jgi:hypothetical protein
VGNVTNNFYYGLKPYYSIETIQCQVSINHSRVHSGFVMFENRYKFEQSRTIGALLDMECTECSIVI